MPNSSHEGFWREYALTLVQQTQSDRAAADAALKNFIAKYSNNGAFQIAVLHAIRKEPDEMFKLARHRLCHARLRSDAAG